MGDKHSAVQFADDTSLLFKVKRHGGKYDGESIYCDFKSCTAVNFKQSFIKL